MTDTHPTPDEAPLLSVDGLRKTYVARGYRTMLGLRPPQRTPALDAVSFSLRAGQVTALLGPNGAGKTTLVSILCDLVRADAGSVTLAGLPVPARGREARRQIGYVTTNDRSFFWRLSGRRNLEFFAALHGYGRSEARQRADQQLARFRLTAHADRLFHSYSAGMKKRLGLARAFLHEPSVLLLDEPTNGLDAASTEELIALVGEEIRDARRTVLWATHRAEEIERLCDRVLVLAGGRLCFDGPTGRFMEISKRHMSFTLHLQPGIDASRFAGILDRCALTRGRQRDDGYLDIHGTGDEQRMSAALGELLAAGALIREIHRQPEPLHRVFAHLEQGDGRASPAPAGSRP